MKQFIAWLCIFFGVPGFVTLVIWLAEHPTVGAVVLKVVVVAFCVFIWGMVCAVMVTDL